MTLSNKFGWMVLTTGNKSELATLYGDMAGGFAVIKDVPKTLVYELCRDLNAARRPRGDPASRASTSRRRAELRPDQKDTDSLPAVRRARPDHRGLRRSSTCRSPSSSRAGTTPSSCARSRGMVDRNEYKRRQAPPGRARVAQGVRQGSPPADHQPLARLNRP